MTLINILFGLIFGILFGFILTKTGVTKYPRVMGMLLLKDFKILKFMLTAVISSMILFHLFSDFSLLKLTPKNLDWGKVVGGLFFGTGMAILGYCPGTLATRIGEGKKDAILAVIGMAIGIFIYALMIKEIKGTFLSSDISGDISALLGINHWFLIVPSILLFSTIIYFLNKKFSDNKKIF